MPKNRLQIVLAFKLSCVVFIILKNVKMPTIVCILTFMSWINFVFSGVEHEKCSITSGPAHQSLTQNDLVIVDLGLTIFPPFPAICHLLS